MVIRRSHAAHPWQVLQLRQMAVAISLSVTGSFKQVRWEVTDDSCVHQRRSAVRCCRKWMAVHQLCQSKLAYNKYMREGGASTAS